MPYHEVFQTWQMVRERRAVHSTVEGTTPAPPPADLRFKSQTTRVEKQMTVAELAVHVQCSPETLTAFERGDEILAPDQLRRLRAALGL